MSTYDEERAKLRALNAPGNPSWYRRAVEAERRVDRAEAEVESLRFMVRTLAEILDYIPGNGLAEKKLIAEAKELAGVAPRG